MQYRIPCGREHETWDGKRWRYQCDQHNLCRICQIVKELVEAAQKFSAVCYVGGKAQSQTWKALESALARVQITPSQENP